MLGKQNKCEAYYTRGRHNNVDVFDIAQSYFRLPRQTVRENANLFILFKQDNTNLSHIYRDHCSTDNIPFHVFKDFCADVWRADKHNFVTLDTSRPAEGGKYRRNLNDYWVYDGEDVSSDQFLSWWRAPTGAEAGSSICNQGKTWTKEEEEDTLIIPRANPNRGRFSVCCKCIMFPPLANRV